MASKRTPARTLSSRRRFILHLLGRTNSLSTRPPAPSLSGESKKATRIPFPVTQPPRLYPSGLLALRPRLLAGLPLSRSGTCVLYFTPTTSYRDADFLSSDTFYYTAPPRVYWRLICLSPSSSTRACSR